MPILQRLAITALLLVGADALYGSKSSVVSLDSKNFAKEILNNNNAAIVEFYAPWCGHCKSLKPAYEKVAASLKGIAKVAAIDCDDDTNKKTCGEYGVQGFPTLKLFVPSGKRGKPRVEDYNGERTAKAIADALVERIPNHVTKVTSATLDEFLSNKNESAKVVLFTSKGLTSPLWKSLAIDFKDDIVFSQIRDKETVATEKFGIEKFPTIVLLPGGKAEGKVYDGKMDKQALFEFFVAVKPLRIKEKPEPKESSSSTTTEVKPTETPKLEVPVLAGLATLRETCFAKKSKTCVIALSEAPFEGVKEAYRKLMARPPPHTFQVFSVAASDEVAKALVEKLELAVELPQLLALNHRAWFRRFGGDAAKPNDILAWLDAIKLGEGKKGKIPEALMVAEEKVEEKTEKVEEAKEEPVVEEQKKGHDEL